MVVVFQLGVGTRGTQCSTINDRTMSSILKIVTSLSLNRDFTCTYCKASILVERHDIIDSVCKHVRVTMWYSFAVLLFPLTASKHR